jgi:L-fuculose-phosphate aldolase
VAPTERLAAIEDVLAACRRIASAGLVSGSNGNVSRRAGDGVFAITRRGLGYDRLSIKDVVLIDAVAEPVEGNGVPSSESLLHLAIYAARPDIGAVIHTHSVWASALAVAGIEIPVLIDEQVFLLGGEVAVAEYAPPMSEALAQNALAALGERRAALLRNHGVVGAGSDIAQAVEVVELVERLAQTYTIARLAGTPAALPAEVIETERQLYRMSAFGAPE